MGYSIFYKHGIPDNVADRELTFYKDIARKFYRDTLDAVEKKISEEIRKRKISIWEIPQRGNVINVPHLNMTIYLVDETPIFYTKIVYEKETIRFILEDGVPEHFEKLIAKGVYVEKENLYSINALKQIPFRQHS